jgi:hypothetical protein
MPQRTIGLPHRARRRLATVVRRLEALAATMEDEAAA